MSGGDSKPKNTVTKKKSNATIEDVQVGCKVMVERDNEEPRKAEILSVRCRRLGRTQLRIAQEAAVAEGRPAESAVAEFTEYYVHYVDYNKRLDEWVLEPRLLLNEGIEYEVPVAETNATGSGSELKGSHKKDPVSKKRPLFGAAAASAKLAAQRNAKNDKKSNKKRALTLEIEPSTPSSTAGASPIPSGSDVNGPLTPTSSTTEQTEGAQETSIKGDSESEKAGEHKNVQGETFSKQGEIEKLRHSGSMTQSQTEVSRVKNLSRIQMGNHEVEAWYFSPYPVEYAHTPVLYICEYCLSFFASDKMIERHRKKCTLIHPPGNEIYRYDGISFFEIDGRKQKTWCRNLCLLSKAFLDHKTLYYDVDPFLFYPMCSYDEHGMHLLGYFSKEKESAENYNLACILTLPQYQRMGYGSLLIEFSYELSKAEGKVGSPEKPLSDLGLLSYRNYWAERIIDTLLESNEDLSIEEISQKTAITTQDLITTCHAFHLLRFYNGQYHLVVNETMLEKYHKANAKKKRKINPAALKWKPPVFSRSDLRFGF